MKKIIQLTNHLGMGGAEALIRDYSLLIDKKKFEILIILTGKSRESFNEQVLKQNNIKMIFIGDIIKRDTNANKIEKIKSKLKQYRYFKKIIEKEKPDIIHSHLATNDFLRVIDTSNIKLFYTIHSEVGPFFSNKRKRLERATNYCIHKKGMTLIALNKKIKTDAEKKFNTKNCIILNNGINMKNFIDLKFNRDEYKRSLNIPINSFVIGHVGRFTELKNHSFLIDIFYEIKKMNRNAHLLLIGEGELMNEVKRKVKKLGINQSVSFLGNRKDIPKLLKLMNTFLFPSIHEGFPISLIEAQAAKVKCVVSDAVTDEVKVTNLIEFVSLNAGMKEWTIRSLNQVTEFEDYGLENFDMKVVISKLEQIYDN